MTVSHSARIWNYWLGGKDNYAVDRAAGDRVAAMMPSIVVQARADRASLGRAVRISEFRVLENSASSSAGARPRRYGGDARRRA